MAGLECQMKWVRGHDQQRQIRCSDWWDCTGIVGAGSSHVGEVEQRGGTVLECGFISVPGKPLVCGQEKTGITIVKSFPLTIYRPVPLMDSECMTEVRLGSF